LLYYQLVFFQGFLSVLILSRPELELLHLITFFLSLRSLFLSFRLKLKIILRSKVEQMYRFMIIFLDKELLQLNLCSWLAFDKLLLMIIASPELLNISQLQSNKSLTYSQHRLELQTWQNHLDILKRLLRAERSSRKLFAFSFLHAVLI